MTQGIKIRFGFLCNAVQNEKYNQYAIKFGFLVKIIQDPVEDWPICDCLISFHSKGFPLEKAIQYAQLRKPYVINNLHMQIDIQDRRKVYSILESVGIEIPRYAVLDRDSPDPKRMLNQRLNVINYKINK